MYNRYNDISKFITDPDELKISDDECVYISGENNYDIMVDLEGRSGSFDEIKPYIAFIAKHINELDNTVQLFDRRKRVKKGGCKEGRLPSPIGITRFDYNKCMEDNPDPGEQRFPFDLALIFLEKPNFVTLDYWCTEYNSQFDVTFEYKEGRFFLRKYGAFELIPDDWDKNLK